MNETSTSNPQLEQQQQKASTSDRGAVPQTPNGDEAPTDLDWGDGRKVVGIGSFHKSLPHNEFGEVDPDHFAAFVALAKGRQKPFTSVASGSFDVARHGSIKPDKPQPTLADLLVSPQAGLAKEGLGPDPIVMSMPPAPGVRSVSTAAEMTELFWMAILRDHAFDDLQKLDDAPIAPGSKTHAAFVDLRPGFAAALADATDAGRLTLDDLPHDGAATRALKLNAQTLFRSGLPGEHHGPLVSQFFLHDVAFGTQVILQKQFPYKPNCDFLTDHQSWLRAQDIGFDEYGDPYPDANDASDNPMFLETTAAGQRVFRRIATMRDLARFVHKDALHQAYFNAALLLLNWRAELDPGNPYNTKHPTPLTRERGFATLGGPHLLTLVSEVASRALKVVWMQKWQVHRRLRPESYGGLMQMQKENGRPYGLPDGVFTTHAAQTIRNAPNRAGTWFLPMAFSSGSPVHPAYGAGHATVAGACVTILKAWFREDRPFAELVEHSPTRTHPLTGKPIRILQPSLTTSDIPDGTGGFEPPTYELGDAGSMTVEGELNKLASNVAMGRSMGGVHWRSDNTRSLRLGEQIAASILAKMSHEVAETPFHLSFRSFNGNTIKIEGGKVWKGTVEADPNDPL